MRKMKKRIVSAVMGLLLAVSAMPMTGLAAGSIDTDRDCELTIQYKHDDTVLSNVEFDLYKIADVDEFARLTLTEAFTQYSVDIGSYKGEAWNELASTLDGYVDRDQWKPEGPKAIDSGKTDTNGTLNFPAEKETMKPGLYLVIGESVRKGEYRYSCDPAIVLLPSEDASTNTWKYEVTMYPKCSAKYDPDDDPKPVTTSKSVTKKWDDDGYRDVRPEYISVTLLKDGEEYDSVDLGVDNNWTYTWTELDASAKWKVTEDVPEGYTVTITSQRGSFLVTNKKRPPENTEVPPSDPENPRTPGEPGDPNDPFGVLGAYDENDPFGVLGAFDMLPQTGTTWWLAAALAGAGMLLFALGIVFRRKAE